jgi:hypothetical protein
MKTWFFGPRGCVLMMWMRGTGWGISAPVYHGHRMWLIRLGSLSFRRVLNGSP